MDLNIPDANIATIVTAFACDTNQARVILSKATVREYPVRMTIIESDALNDQLFIMLAGHAQMHSYAINGRLIVVEDYHVGNIFGEGGLISAQIEAEQVVAVELVQAGSFQNQIFIGLMSTYSCIALAFSRLMVERLSKTTRRLVEGATLSANGRIHAELLRQARAAQAMTIKPAPVLSIFAQSVQSTRETVSRAISALEKRGIIRRDELSLTIVAPHRLEELVY